ncbi:MAG TPA: VanW family protein [Anaerolineaceae bacterium]|nr:VanW family protein [Anaerolineaceae bacterium]HQC64047.1 VanW family protein [Anaerolineaceae bacterium]
METTQKMNLEQNKPQNPHGYARRGKQIAFSLFVGLFIATLTLIIIAFRYEAKYKDKIYPTIRANDIDLTGLSLGQAVSRLNTDLNYPAKGRIVFSYNNQQWAFTPQELGYSNNPTELAIRAYQTGRDGNWLQNLQSKIFARRQGIELNPSAMFDQPVAFAKLEEIAREINQPLVEAGISIEGTQVTVHDGQIGLTLDIPATLDKLQAYFLIQQDANIPLIVRENSPEILHAGDIGEQAQAILSAPLTLRHPDPDSGLEPWVIPAEDLASLLIIERDTSSQTVGYKLDINATSLEHYLSSIAAKFVVQPENARMRFNEDTRQFELIRNAVMGKVLDVEASLDVILHNINNHQHEVNLVLKDLAPRVTDTTTAAELGITELVVQETSYFYGSEAARVQNIQVGSSTFDGILIAPGEVFSMAKYMTNISLDNGYAEAIIIVGDQSVKGVGGGICQVSTTLFRTAFYGGYPIVERHSHAYRVGYYEQQSNGWANTNLAGLDASIYLPFADLKFKNDSDYWILMDTEMGPNSLTWKFYSTSDGRRVEWSTTGITDVVEPPEPIYREDPTLPRGTIKQVDWAVNGATVSVTRRVYKGDQLWFSDVINTTYMPWPDGFNYGPGTEIP